MLKRHGFKWVAYKVICGKAPTFSHIMEQDKGVVIIDRPDKRLAELTELDEKQLKYRFAHGDKAFVLEEDGVYHGIMWGHDGPCYIRGAGLSLCMARDEVYIYGIYTRPESRRRNVFNRLKDGFFSHYAGGGATTYYALVAYGNHVMLRAFDKLGLKPEGLILYVRFLGTGVLIGCPYRGRRLTFKSVTGEPAGMYVI